MLNPKTPALVFAPMDGITDAPMRDLQGAQGAFTYCVSEFIRVSVVALPPKVFRREIPELATDGKTPSGMPVQVQLLGGDPERMARTALSAVWAGAKGIDINFGCPAPTVNRNDGGASLLRHPCRIREIVSAVREAVPKEIPVSAKLRLGWDSIDAIEENAAMAAEGGANWLTIHARTRVQGYSPPVFWPKIGHVQRSLGLPVVANGDIWNFEDFLRCRDETGCMHFMIGRSALSNPGLPRQIAVELGIALPSNLSTDWCFLFDQLAQRIGVQTERGRKHSLMRLKQWIKIAHLYGEFPFFHELKTAQSYAELMTRLRSFEHQGSPALQIA